MFVKKRRKEKYEIIIIIMGAKTERNIYVVNLSNLRSALSICYIKIRNFRTFCSILFIVFLFFYIKTTICNEK